MRIIPEKAIEFFFGLEIGKIQTIKTSFGFILDSRLCSYGRKKSPFSGEKNKRMKSGYVIFISPLLKSSKLFIFLLPISWNLNLKMGDGEKFLIFFVRRSHLQEGLLK